MEEEAECQHQSIVIKTNPRGKTLKAYNGAIEDIYQSITEWEKDFSKAMQNILYGQYANFPYEMISTIRNNVDDMGNITFNNKAEILLYLSLKSLIIPNT